MASRNSFLDSPSFRRITTPSQRESVSRRRRSSGFRGGGSSSDPIRRETMAERQQRERQERLKSFQSELSDSGARLTEAESQAILEGKPVSEIREQVATRQRRQGFASLQRDLSRSGTRLTSEEAELIASGEGSPSDVRERISQRRGREFTRSSGTNSFVETSRGDVAVSEGFASRTQELQKSGAFERAREQERARQLEAFAAQSDDLTVVSGVDGPMLVTTSGESVGGVSLTEFASFDGRDPRTRVVTSSGRDVTPRETIEVNGFVSASDRTPFSQTRAGRLIGPQSDADAVRDFAGGFSEGVLRPGDSVTEVFQVGEQGRIAAMSSTRASTAGQFLGVASSASALGLGIFGSSFGLGAARQAGVRGLSRLGFTSVASRQALGATAAPVVIAGFLAPEVSQRTFRFATGRSTLGEELFGFGVNRAVEFGAARIVGSGARRAFRAGEAATEASGRAFTRNKVLQGFANIDDVVRPQQAQVLLGSQASVRAGQTPFIRTITNQGSSRQFLNVPSSSSRQFRTADGLLQTSFSLQNFVENPEFDLATITTPQGTFGGATRVFRGPGALPVASGFIPEAALASTEQRVFGFSRDLDGLQVGFVGRETPTPPTISRSELLSELRFLQDFSSGRRVLQDLYTDPYFQRTDPVDGLISLQPSDQFGLEAFGDMSFSPASEQRALRSLQQRSRISSPTSNLIFSEIIPGSSLLFESARSVGRFSSFPPRSTRLGARPSRAASRRSRSVDDVSFGFVPRISISSGLRGGLASIQGLSGAQRTPFSLGQEDLFGLRNNQGLRGSQRIAQDTDIIQRTAQDSQLITFPRLTTRPPTRRPPTRRTPPRRPRTPRIPDLDLPPLNFGLSQRRTGRGRSGRREEFTPSLVANFLNIRGELPGVSTGIELRPILQ